MIPEMQRTMTHSSGLRALGRRVADRTARHTGAVLGFARQLDLLDSQLPALDVLVVGLDRGGSRLPDAVAEIRRSRHAVRICIGTRASQPTPGLQAETKATGMDGGTFENVEELLRGLPADQRHPRWTLVVDNDVVLPHRFLDRFVAACEHLDFSLAQPAQTPGGYTTGRVTRQRSTALARLTRFAEIGPVTAFRDDAQWLLTPFPKVGIGNLDLHWGAAMEEHGLRMGVVDATPIVHQSRPPAVSQPPAIVQEAAQESVRTYRRKPSPSFRRLKHSVADGFHRIYAIEALHRAVPTALALRLAAVRGHWRWARQRGTRARSRAQMELVLMKTHRRSEASSLARRRIVEMSVQSELLKRPWAFAGAEVVGLGNLDDAIARRSGVILAVAHVHPFFTSIIPLHVLGYRLNVMAGGWVFETPRESPWARSLRGMRGKAERHGLNLVPPGGAYGVLRDLLSENEICYLAVDGPGAMRTTFVNKEAGLARGVPNLAMETGAPVVPLSARRVGARPTLIVNRPMLPSAYPSADALMTDLADWATAEVLEQPQALLDFGALPVVWSRDADPYRWAFPPWGPSPKTL